MEDDFFAVGGDSISAMMLCGELRRRHTLRPSAVFARRSARDASDRRAGSGRQGGPRASVDGGAGPTGAAAPTLPDFAELAPVLPLQKGRCSAQLGQQAANFNAFTRLQFTGALDSGRLLRPCKRC